MSQNFAHFVRQFGIQNPVILDSFKFSVHLLPTYLGDSSDSSDSCDSCDSIDSIDNSDHKTLNTIFFSLCKQPFFFTNSRTKIVMELKNSNCDET